MRKGAFSGKHTQHIKFPPITEHQALGTHSRGNSKETIIVQPGVLPAQAHSRCVFDSAVCDTRHVALIAVQTLAVAEECKCVHGMAESQIPSPHEYDTCFWDITKIDDVTEPRKGVILGFRYLLTLFYHPRPVLWEMLITLLYNCLCMCMHLYVH